MPEETIDPGLLEQTKNQIRKLVAEIADLAESDIQPAEFHVEFLNRAVAAVAASGGVFWLLDGRGKPRPDRLPTGRPDRRRRRDRRAAAGDRGPCRRPLAAGRARFVGPKPA